MKAVFKSTQNKVIKLTVFFLSVIILFAVTAPFNVYAVTPHFTEKVGENGVTLTISTEYASGNIDAGNAIQSALNTARDNATDSKPYTIVIPKGTYRLEDHLNIYSNTHLSMNGATLVRCYNEGGTMLKLGTINDVKSGYNGYRNITLSGGVWDGNVNDAKYGASKTKVFTPLQFGHAKNIKLDGVWVKGGVGAHLLEVGAVDGIEIANCKFTDQIFTEANGQEALQFDIACYDVFKGFPSFDGTGCKNAVVKNCTFENVYRGVGTHSSVLGKTMDNIIITNNTFKNIAEEAIIATNYRNSKITSNTIENAGIGINFLYYRNIHVPANGGSNVNVNCNTTISNNKISVAATKYEPEPCGIRVYGYNQTKQNNSEGALFDTTKAKSVPVGDYRVTGLTVTQNNITTQSTSIKSEEYGIRLYRTFNSKVTSNTIVNKSSTSKTGIMLFESNNNSISGNTIQAFYDNGIYVSYRSSDNTVENNKINNSKNRGISLYDTCTGNKINKNIISNVSNDGISVAQKSTATVTNNTIAAKANGIHIYTSSTVTAQGNTIKGVGARGIYASASTVNISGNTVSNPSKAGIYITGSKANVKKNIINNNKDENGIGFYSKSTGTIEGNTVTASAKNGIYLSNSTATVSSNNIKSSKNDGISITASPKTAISKNAVTSGGRYGIYISNSTSVTASDNTINTAPNGIYVTSNSQATLVRNKISGVKSVAITVAGAKAYGKTNTPSAPKANGTSTSSSTVTVKWNAVKDVTGYEVYRLSNGTYKKIAATKSTSFTDKKLSSATEYTYRVLAYRNTGKVLIRGSYTTIKATTNLNTPVIKLTAGKKKAAVSWGKISSANGYEVFMSTSKNGSYKKIATLNASKTSYTKTSLPSGKTYYFRVRAYTTISGKRINSAYQTKAIKIK